jgi:hypothetical protein
MTGRSRTIRRRLRVSAETACETFTKRFRGTVPDAAARIMTIVVIDPVGGMTGRVPESGSAEPIPVSEAPQAAQILTTEPAPCFLYADKAWICRFLVVGILGVVAATVGVHDASEPLFFRRAGRKDADPACLGCVRLPHATSMKVSYAARPSRQTRTSRARRNGRDWPHRPRSWSKYARSLPERSISRPRYPAHQRTGPGVTGGQCQCGG